MIIHIAWRATIDQGIALARSKKVFPAQWLSRAAK
jgi:hypothetical protein